MLLCIMISYQIYKVGVKIQRMQVSQIQEVLIDNYIQQLDQMIYLILAFGFLYWAALAYFAHSTLKKAFKKYRNTPRLDVPQHYTAFLRLDFGKWDEKAMLRRAWTHFPLRFTMMATALTVYAIMGTLNCYCRFPTIFLINLWRKYFGGLAFRLIVRTKEEFDVKQKIETPIVVANHSTFLDILYFGFCQESIVSFVSKKEIEELPTIREVARFLQTILVDRSSPEARAKVKRDIEERVESFQKDRKNVFPLLIFPQGTVSNGRSLMQFKSGAFQSLSPITLFSLRYQCKQFHMGDNELSFLDHILMSCVVNCELKVSKKVVQPVKNETVQQYTQRCRKELSKMGNYKIYDTSFKEYIEYTKLFKQKLAELKQSSANQ